jgi:hypothetical protein
MFRGRQNNSRVFKCFSGNLGPRISAGGVLWSGLLFWRRQSGSWNPLFSRPCARQPSDWQRSGAMRRGVFVWIARCVMQISAVRASTPARRHARPAVAAGSSACPDLPHRHIPHSCGCLLWPCPFAAVGGRRPPALPWTARSRWPAEVTSRRVDHGECCGFPRGRIHRPAWLTICPRVCPYEPSAMFFALA